MKTYHIVTLFGVGMVAVAGTAAASSAKPWLTLERYGDLRIVVAGSASPSEKTAAAEFGAYWKQCTGHTVGISDRPGDDGVNVWIGRDGVPDSLLAKVKLGGLGDDGLCIRTVGPNDLLIIGGKKRGTLYGVYRFFEKYMGVRFLAPDVTHVPAAPASLPCIDFRYVPPLRYRDTNYWMFRRYPDFALKHGFNGNGMGGIPEEKGGNIGFANGFGHTFFSFVHPDEYGAAHPEYFSEINGRRVANARATQLCLTNPDVLQIATDKTREILRNSPPNKRIVCITQMDWGFYCECATCRAIDEREGSQSGTMIHFVNQVAAAIEDEFPDAFIDTFAYTYTRKPPKTLKPRDNVIVRLCSIECDFSRPLRDRSSELNRAFQRDITKWSKIAKNLFIWDYTQNWHCFQQPHPNIQVLQPNAKFFVEHGVTGLFEQASHSRHSDFDMLKAYIVGHAVWDPDVDWEALYDEFLELYYGAAAPYIRAYHDLIKNQVLDTGYRLTIFSQMDWMTYEVVEQAQVLFKQAFDAVEDETVRQRLRYAYVPVQHAALVCPPRIETTDDAYVLTRPPSQTFDEYWDMIIGYGITHNGDDPISKFRERLRGETPPRRQEMPIQKLENEYWEVWLVADLAGAVVKFRDKRTGVDWFKARDAILKGKYTLQEWHIMNPESPKLEEPINTPYKVVAQGGSSVVFETKLDNGLVVRRTTSLPRGSETVDMAFEVENVSGAALVPRVKPHPEFWLQGDNVPEFWVECDGRWEKRVDPADLERRTGIGVIDPAGVTRWAMYLPKKRLTLVNEVCAEELQNLLFYFNLDNQHANLEAYPLLTPLEPGEERTMHLSYSVSRKPPKKL